MPRSSLLAGFLFLIGTLCATAQAAELSGMLDWGRRVALGTLESGMVAKVAVVEGQRVRQGALLLRLDQRGFKADLAAARAAYRHAQALLAEAQREYDRAQELYDRTVLSDHERTVAVIGLREAQAAAEAARARQVRARLALERSELRAPFDGVVERLSVVPGQAVNARLAVPSLLVLADDRRLAVKVPADEATRQALLAAESVQVELGGRALPVADISLAGDGSGSVRLALERPRGLSVRPGRAVTVRW